MTSPAPLTEAEKAAAQALSKVATANGFRLHELRADMARAVVAAIRPILTIAALEGAATALDELAAANARAGRGTAEGPWIAAGVQGAALNVRRQARELRQSLSLPASKETP